MVPVQVTSISNDEPHFFPGAGSGANGLCSVGTDVAGSDSLMLVRQPGSSLCYCSMIMPGY